MIILYFALSPVREMQREGIEQEAKRVAQLTPAQLAAEARERERQAKADADKKAAEAKVEADSHKFSHLVSSCEVEWEMKHKSRMKDPDSLDWDRKNANVGMYKEKIPVIIVPYRAKNGFNALTLEQAVCEINPNTYEVLSVF